MGGLDLAFVALGTLGDQRRAETDFSHAEEMLEGNLTGVVSLLTPIANYFEAQKRGAIVVIGSVAGDRGRQGNYIYAAAKAGLHTFLQGLRARLFRSGVRVVTVKPGFVDTKMIFGRPGVFLAASPDQVAADILSGLKKGRDIIYTPFFWSPVMLILRHIPERLFKRLTV
jgi:short-subunit dehydrogenase